MTKLHEYFYRNNIDDIGIFKSPIKGELTICNFRKKYQKRFLDENKIKKKAKIFLKNIALKMLLSYYLSQRELTEKIYKICLDLKKE